MDSARRLVPVLDVDPKVNVLPMVGAWVRAPAVGPTVDLVRPSSILQNPYVWSTCLRYIYR